MKARRINIGHLTLVLALWATVAPAFGQTIWIDGTGDWFNPANWSAGVPSSTTNGRVNNGGHAQITVSGAMGGASLGFGSQDSGTLSVSGSGRLDAGVDVGVSGTGFLNITNGGVFTSGRFVMADQPGSHGTATVSGSGSMWTNSVVCFVGFLGTATLNITAGGRVSDSSASVGESGGSVGLVMIDGAGSVWTHSGNVTVAGDGTGTLLVANGGRLITNGFGFGSVIGRNPGSNGVATVSGAGSAWTGSGSLGVASGFAGTNGALHIASGGTVSNASGRVGGNGGSGTATVDGVGSTWVNNGDLFLPGSRVCLRVSL